MIYQPVIEVRNSGGHVVIRVPSLGWEYYPTPTLARELAWQIWGAANLESVEITTPRRKPWWAR